MYTPPKFKIDDPETIRSFIEDNSFGLLLSLDGSGIQDTHTPFIFSEDGKSLLGHIARANPQWKSWTENRKVKVIFSGPHAYISPSYYITEFAVPTWNYSAVSISGDLMIVDEEKHVLEFLDKLVAKFENPENPWRMNRADERYMKLLSGIVAFSISIESVEASFKMNQNKSEKDRSKVIDSLSASKCPFDHEVASMMSTLNQKAEQGGAGQRR